MVPVSVAATAAETSSLVRTLATPCRAILDRLGGRRAGLERMASDLMVEIRLVETALEAKGRTR